MVHRTARVLSGALCGLVLLAAACTATPAPDRGAADARTRAAIGRALAPYVTRDDPVRAVLVLAHGRTVYARYQRAPATAARPVFAVDQVVLSALVGIAIAEGRIAGVEVTLDELLPAYRDSMTPAVARITLRQVLTMTAGFPGVGWPGARALARADDPVRALLAAPVARPGRQFIYSDAGDRLVSAVLERATGLSAADYARSRLFGLLGIRDRYDAAGRLELRPVDMARLGRLYLDGGRWHGRQVVPADWVQQALGPQVASAGPPVSLAPAYGYFWWVDPVVGDPSIVEESGFLAWGEGGQVIELVPREDLVVVVSTAVDPRRPRDTGISSGHTAQIVDAVANAVAATR